MVVLERTANEEAKADMGKTLHGIAMLPVEDLDIAAVMVGEEQVELTEATQVTHMLQLERTIWIRLLLSN